MKKAAFYTLGCKVNTYETEGMSALFTKENYEIVNFEDKADVYVINTCTVTNLSDRKSRQMIRKAKKNNPDSIIIVTGCYSQIAPDEVLNIEGVNLVIGTKDRSKIIEYIKNIETNKQKINMVSDVMNAEKYEEMWVDTYKEKTRAFLKIQEGCNQFCSYCIIPYVRGPIRSRQSHYVLEEVKNLVQKGFKEIVLTGIHLGSYGKDIKEMTLLALLEEVHKIEGIKRIRLGSLEPKLINREFVEVVSGLNKVCSHFHLSLQSGCNDTLKRMNRKYTTEEFEKSVDLLRSFMKGVAITTDIIVGFPGETEKEFEKTIDFVDYISFAQAHIFKFSPRKGTPAENLPDQVSDKNKDVRSSRLIELSRKKTINFNSQFLDREVPVLFEQYVKGKKDYIEGLTENYINVKCPGEEEYLGKIVNVQIKYIEDEYVVGEIKNNIIKQK